MGTLATLSPLILVIEEVLSPRFCVPYPTTTISAIVFSADFRETLTDVCDPIVTSSGCISTEEKINCFAVDGTDNDKVPSVFVVVPVLVPFTSTETLAIGLP